MIPLYALSSNWNITRRWSFVSVFDPTDRLKEEMGITELPALVALFPDSTVIDKG
jgi:hypothetical protein